MFKVSFILTDTAMQSLLPLADCSVNNTLVEEVPFLSQPFFHMINVTDPAGSGRQTQPNQSVALHYIRVI